MERGGTLIIIAGPSGAGKTTISNYLLKPFDLHFVATYTTRQPRSGERDGVDYNFVSVEQFEKLNADGFFFETNFYNNTWYGSPKDFESKLNAGKSAIILPDINGAQKLMQEYNTLSIWVHANLDQLKERLQRRRTESDEQLERRLTRAQKEHEEAVKLNIFDHMILNDDLNKTITQVKAIIANHLAAK